MTRLSGCQALAGCTMKDHCARYFHFLNSTPYEGFNAYQTCRLSHFTEKRYLHFVSIAEFLISMDQESRAVTVQRANSD